MAQVAKNKDINLLLALDRKPDQAASSANRRLSILLLALVIVVVAGSAFLYLSKLTVLVDDKNKYEEYLNDPAVINDYNESFSAKSESESMQALAHELSDAIADEKSYPDITSTQIKKIYRLAGGQVKVYGLEYNRSAGTLSFSASSGTVSRIPIFVAELRSSGIFTDVSYDGYQRNIESTPGKTTIDKNGIAQQSTVSKQTFSFNVVGLLIAPENDEEAE